MAAVEQPVGAEGARQGRDLVGTGVPTVSNHNPFTSCWTVWSAASPERGLLECVARLGERAVDVGQGQGRWAALSAAWYWSITKWACTSTRPTRVVSVAGPS